MERRKIMQSKSIMTYDNIIKNIFTNPSTGKEYASHIIGEVLDISPDEIYDNLEYIYPEIQDNIDAVKSTMDVSFETDKIIINIEVNRNSGKRRKVQNDTYVFQLYLRELKSSKYYDKIRPVIQINLDTYDYLRKDEFEYVVKLMDTKYHIVVSDKLLIVHLNLLKLRDMDIREVKNDRLKTTLYFLASSNEKLIKELYRDDEFMKKVKEQADSFASGIDWADLYFDAEETFQNDLHDIVMDEVREEITEQVTKDVTEKVTKDITEKVTNEIIIKNVQNMLKANLSDKDIIEYLDISKEELDKIKKKIC